MPMTIHLIRHNSGECMECGKTGTKFDDRDGSSFCKVACAKAWHGDVVLDA